MINAGMLNKAVYFFILNKVKNEYGEEVIFWECYKKIRCQVIGNNSKNLMRENYENWNKNMIVVRTLSTYAKLFKLSEINYRIKYNCKDYRLLNANLEDKNYIEFIAELINE